MFVQYSIIYSYYIQEIQYCLSEKLRVNSISVPTRTTVAKFVLLISGGAADVFAGCCAGHKHVNLFHVTEIPIDGTLDVVVLKQGKQVERELE